MGAALILGTRPEIIKFAPVIRELERRGEHYTLIHTGQHYSPEMDRVFFEDLGLRAPDHNLGCGSGGHGAQTGRMLERLERTLLAGRPEVVLVQGDTNTTLAGALASAKLRVPVGHVEAGLRSFDRRMPEEINRVLTDHVSDILFAPTEVSASNLANEGIDTARTFVTGNTVVDALQQNMGAARRRGGLVERLDLWREGYIVLTLHREENVDDPRVLSRLLAGVGLTVERLGMRVIYPVHPRTRRTLALPGMALPGGVEAVDPPGYLDFLHLESRASLILTDSGGVQEEACTLRVPCVTLRESTERPETVSVGANLVAGTSPERVAEAAERMLARERTWENPLGDGRAGERIVDILIEHPGAN